MWVVCACVVCMCGVYVCVCGWCVCVCVCVWCVYEGGVYVVWCTCVWQERVGDIVKVLTKNSVLPRPVTLTAAKASVPSLASATI